MKTILLLICTILVIGCAAPPVPDAISQPARQAVYATHDSIKAGRFDLADKYSDQSVQLIPPPSKKITITPIYDPSDAPSTAHGIRGDIETVEKHRPLPGSPEAIWLARAKADEAATTEAE